MSEASRLAVFDIDGTLTDTTAVDEECYLLAVEATLGVPTRVVGGEWTAYPEITDAGIAATLARRHLGRAIEADELRRLEDELVVRLTEAFDRAPERCRPLPGAVEFLADLESRPGWRVALATGGFRRSALLKLMRAGFGPPSVLAASGALRGRAEIVRSAISQAVGPTGRSPAEPGVAPSPEIVLLGDGPWDVATARTLGLPCIGIGDDEAAARLQRLGAVAVLPDYSDPGRAIGLLEAAAAGRLDRG